MRNSWTGGEALSAVSEPLELAVAVHRREAGAFERLVETYERSLFRYAERILQDRNDAEEVVQDTLLRAHKALTRQYTEERCRELAVKPWLFRITRNLAFNKGRGRKASLQMTLHETESEKWHLRGLSRPPAVTVELERREEKKQLEDAIAVLPPEYRELIILRFMEEMSYAEISKTVGSNEASLRGKVFRSLKLLREALGAKGVANALS
jgi:RNA polymerase sigma-70 factor (ECF subfamily)